MKLKTILVGKDGRPSMKKVYSQMTTKDSTLQIRRQIKGKDPYIRLFENQNIETFTKKSMDFLIFNNSVVIRWGNRIVCNAAINTIVYNKVSAIENATNKKRSREIFISNNVNTPKLYNKYSIFNVDFPVIARPLVHSKGKNFFVLTDIKDFVDHYVVHKENHYYSEYIDKEREFRVHCGHSKVLAIMEKPKVEGQMAWNRAINHEAFARVKQVDYIYDICLQAVNAIKSLGLDFGGVDVIYKDGKAYVLEVNTAPTLNSSEFVSSQYAKYFDWLFKSETRKEHWDYIQWKKADSFAWKQNQF